LTPWSCERDARRSRKDTANDVVAVVLSGNLRKNLSKIAHNRRTWKIDYFVSGRHGGSDAERWDNYSALRLFFFGQESPDAERCDSQYGFSRLRWLVVVRPRQAECRVALRPASPAFLILFHFADLILVLASDPPADKDSLSTRRSGSQYAYRGALFH
jgi:hypothetical protein